jgi:cystathionine gamma-synthase
MRTLEYGAKIQAAYLRCANHAVNSESPPVGGTRPVASLRESNRNAAVAYAKIDNRELNLITLAQMKIETLAVHAGHTIDPATGAVAAPIYLSTTYERDIEGTYSRGFMYTRNNNPNRQALERGVSLLEGGDTAAAFGSGMAAAMALFQALTPGDHVLAHVDAYYGTSRLLREIFLRWGLEADFIDMSKLDEIKRALRPQTKLAWAETPSNPLLKIVDLAAVAQIVHQAGALCICDNTWAPVLQRPFELGADLILYSTTKYFGGHCDVAGGIVVAKKDSEFFHRIRSIQYEGGAVPSPFDCWLILRGMRTLPWRMRAHSENATKVADFLSQHRKVARVHYPGLQSHPGHKIAVRQMSMFGGMLSFEVRDGRDAAMSVAAKTKIFIRATSLGGVESLIEHRASIEGPGTTSSEGLIRLSIGLENADDLIEDLDQALG